MTDEKPMSDWNIIEGIGSLLLFVGPLLLLGRSISNPTSFDEAVTNFSQTIQKRIGMNAGGKCSSICDKITNRCIHSCSTDFIKKGDPECGINACIAEDGLCYDMPINALGCTKQIAGKAGTWGVFCAEVKVFRQSSKKIECMTFQQRAYEEAQYQNRQTTVRQTITTNNVFLIDKVNVY